MYEPTISQPQRGASRTGRGWQRDSAPSTQEHGVNETAVIVTGLALLGLGVLAWYTFGPDLQRYLKIRGM